MAEQVYEWVRSLAGYYLFLAVLEQLLSGKTYWKYVRFFAGIVLILLVLKPVTKGLRLEDALVREYESILFQYEADDLQQELLGAEKERLSRMVEAYEQAAARAVEELARADGYVVQACRVQVEGRRDDARFGQVLGISMEVEKNSVTESSGIGTLRQKLAQYYDLEAEHVAIQIVEGKG